MTRWLKKMRTFHFAWFVCLLSLALIMFTGLGCGGGDSNSSSVDGGGTGDDGTDGGVAGDGTTPGLTFSVDKAQSLITTENIANTSTAAVRSVRADGRTIPTLYFREATPPGGRDKDAVGVVRAAETDTGILADEAQAGSNLVGIDENGVAAPAITSIEELSVIYTLLSPDQRKVYVVLNPDEMHNAQQTIGETNCMLFEVSLANNAYTCLDAGYAPQIMDNNYRQTVSDSKSKPIQTDEEGNVYYLGQPFTVNANSWCEQWDDFGNCVDERTDYWLEMQWDAEPVIRKISVSKDPDGHPLYNEDGTLAYEAPVSLTPDSNIIDKFLVSKEGVMVYTYYERDTGNGGIKMYADGSTNDLSGDTTGWWGDMFFTVGDAGTVIYGSSSNNWGNDGIKFAKRHETVTGARRVVQLNTSLFTSRNNSPTPSRIILADDGYIYGLFNEDAGYHDETTSSWINANRINLFRVLPYRQTPIFSILYTGDDWWQIMNQFDVQISMGYAYYVMTDEHPTNLYGNRDVIKITKLTDGETITLLDRSEMSGGDLLWLDRFELYSWKLIDSIIYFSGFNNSNSEVIVGEIDILKLRRGLPALPENEGDDHYLSIKAAASALGETARIVDMEVVRPEPVMDPQGYPVIKQIYTDQENIYSASIDFSKYMDREDVEGKVTVMDEGTEEEIAYAMKVWTYKTLHLIFDTDLGNTITDPLAADSLYAISVDETAMDFTGQTLDMNDDDPLLSTSFRTVPGHGWYQSTAIALEGYSDGSVGKYVAQSGSDFWLEHYRLLGCSDAETCEGFDSENFKLEFSLQHLSESGQVTLRLNDAKRIDWNNVDWNQATIKDQDGIGDEWRWQDGHRADALGNQYYWCNTDVCGEGVEGIYDQNDVVYAYIQGHDEDISGNQYFSYWDDAENRDGYKIYDTAGTDPFTVLWKQGFWTDPDGTVYEWSFGEYRDTTDPENIMDQNSGVDYTWNEGYYERVDTGAAYDIPGLQWVPGMYTPPTGDPISENTYWSDEFVWVDGYYYKVGSDPLETETAWQNDWQHTVPPEDFVKNTARNNWEARLWELQFNLNWGDTLWGDYRTSLDSSQQMQTMADQLSRREWYKFTVSVYGTNLIVEILDADGEQVAYIPKDDYFNTTRTNSGTYFLDLNMNEDTIKMDNVVVTKLDVDGNVVTDVEGDPVILFSEDFSSATLDSAFAIQRWYETD